MGRGESLCLISWPIALLVLPTMSPEFLGKVILRASIANKIQHGTALFIVRQPQAASQLLQEDGETFRWS